MLSNQVTGEAKMDEMFGFGGEMPVSVLALGNCENTVRVLRLKCQKQGKVTPYFVPSLQRLETRTVMYMSCMCTVGLPAMN